MSTQEIPSTDRSRIKDPTEWTTGEEPMTGAQDSYLHTLAREAGKEVDDELTKAEASMKIDNLREKTGVAGAPVTMHPEDAAMVRAGKTLRPLTPAPGLINGLLGRLLLRFAGTSIEAAEVEHEIQDGETLPITGGLVWRSWSSKLPASVTVA
jgi:hypothetical protein